MTPDEILLKMNEVELQICEIENKLTWNHITNEYIVPPSQSSTYEALKQQYDYYKKIYNQRADDNHLIRTKILKLIENFEESQIEDDRNKIEKMINMYSKLIM